jgi:hypothetical protein
MPQIIALSAVQWDICPVDLVSNYVVRNSHGLQGVTTFQF